MCTQLPALQMLGTIINATREVGRVMCSVCSTDSALVHFWCVIKLMLQYGASMSEAAKK